MPFCTYSSRGYGAIIEVLSADIVMLETRCISVAGSNEDFIHAVSLQHYDVLRWSFVQCFQLCTCTKGCPPKCWRQLICRATFNSEPHRALEACSTLCQQFYGSTTSFQLVRIAIQGVQSNSPHSFKYNSPKHNTSLCAPYPIIPLYNSLYSEMNPYILQPRPFPKPS